MKIKPYVYQVLAEKAGVKALLLTMKALLVLATGLGKTITAALIAKKLRARRVLFLVHSNFILNGAREDFRLVFDENTKMAIYNGHTKKGAKEADIVFATWQTMGKNLKQWARDHFDLIIVDEAHHTQAETYLPVAKYFTGAKLGMTATPEREDEEDIREIFGPEVVNISLEEAIARGWGPPIEYHAVNDESLDENALQKIVEEIRGSKKRFTMAEVNRRIFIRKRDEEIARMINLRPERGVVFCGSIEHANRIAGYLDNAATFHSSTGATTKKTWDRNQQVLQALKEGRIRKVCAVDAFNEGVNVPTIRFVAFCRSTKSVRIFKQQLGRGARPGPGVLVVYDYVGNIERVQMVLEMMNRIADLHEKYNSRSALNAEGYSRKPFEVSGAGFNFTFSDEIVDLMKVLEHCDRDFYPTWQEASSSVRSLGIDSIDEYAKRYLEDEKLPSNPSYRYVDFPGWPSFLGRFKQVSNSYATWQEAGKAAAKVGIRTTPEYAANYKKDPRLPSRPEDRYADFPGWSLFLGNKKFDPYLTWQESARSARRLGIKSSHEYKKKKAYKKDPKLPAMPDGYYKNFPGWDKFFGRSVATFYPTWQQAAKAVKKVGITTSAEYAKWHGKDPCLPAALHLFYKDFPGFGKFFGRPEKYPTWQQASRAVLRLGISSSVQYRPRKGYKLDPKLPSYPEKSYSDFPGWPKFLGRG